MEWTNWLGSSGSSWGGADPLTLAHKMQNLSPLSPLEDQANFCAAPSANNMANVKKNLAPPLGPGNSMPWVGLQAGWQKMDSKTWFNIWLTPASNWLTKLVLSVAKVSQASSWAGAGHIQGRWHRCTNTSWWPCPRHCLG